MYIPLINQTEYSLKESTIKVNELISLAKKNKMPYIGVSESGTFFSTMEFYMACKQDKEKQLKAVKENLIKEEDVFIINPIVGIKTYVNNDLNYLHLICKNYQSYKELIKPVTLSQLNKKDEKPIFNINDISNPNSIFVLSGNTLSSILLTKKELIVNIKYYENLLNHFENLSVKAEKMTRLFSEEDKKDINKKIKQYKQDLEKLEEEYNFKKDIEEIVYYNEALSLAKKYQKRFGDNFFIEISNHKEELELYVNPLLIKIAKELNIPLVATHNSYYVDKENKRAKDLLIAIDNKTTLSDKTLLKDNGEYYFLSEEEITKRFENYPQEAIENTMKIAKECSFELDEENHFPKFPIPEGETIESYLRKTTYEGAKRKFSHLSKEEKLIRFKRIEKELEVINKLHYSEYTLIVSDFLKEGRRIGEVGPGRGSAVGSIVSYLNDITDVDPIPYNLYFERYLNEERVSQPDIDSDFCDKREDVINYCKKKYGEDHVCQIITFGTMAARKVIRDVGRVTNKSLALCDKIAKMIPAKPDVTIKKALGWELNKQGEKFEEFFSKELLEEYNNSSEIQELINDCLLVEGLKVNTGTHAAGVIISDLPTNELIPLYYTEKNGEMIWVSQYDKNLCENPCKLLKMDFLGLENLTIMKRTKSDILKNKGIEINMNNIDLNDKNLYENIFQKGKTKGIFQFESFGMQQLLKRFKPTKIEDLILLNAVYRPGPIQYIDEIIAVKNGEKKPEYIVSELAEICDETYGKPVYQEQIMQIFNKIGGFTLGTADIIRRAMSKKKTKELQLYMPDFKKALISKGASEKEADDFCEELMEFARYAFNKSHSTAYAVVAVYTAFFKHYYTVEYMANLMTSKKEIKDISSIINECKSLNIKLEHPNVNKSFERFIPTKEGTILYGLQKIKNVGKSSEAIVKARGNKTFNNVEEFINRVLEYDPSALDTRVLKSLVYTGAFDEISIDLNKNQLASGIKNYINDKKEKVKLNIEIKELQQTLDENLKEIGLNNIFELNKDEVEVLKYMLDKIKTAKTKQTKNKAIDKFKETSLCDKLKYDNTDLVDYINDILSTEEVFDMFIETYEKIKIILKTEKLLNTRFDKISNIKDKDYFPFVAEENKNVLLEEELNLMGYYYSGHPLDIYESIIKSQTSHLICDLGSDEIGQYVTLIGRVKNYKRIQRKSDNADMCFFELEDTTSLIKVCVFTKAFDKNKNFFINDDLENTIVKVTGKVFEGNDEYSDTLQLTLDDIQSVLLQKLFIKTDEKNFSKIKNICFDFEGSIPVYVYINNKIFKLNEIYVNNSIEEYFKNNNIEYVLK